MNSFRMTLSYLRNISFRNLTVRLFHNGSRCSHSALVQQKAKLQDCCSTLEVDKNCTEEELRAAYLKKVKEHHPDRQKDKEGSVMINKIYDAYHTLLDHKRGQKAAEHELATEGEEEEEIIRHTAPQHRQYLTFEGVGYGTPSKRKRQYQQFRIERANERIFEHRKLKFGADEDAVVAKDKAQARKIKTSNLIHRLVDDMVRESMQRGDFDNLAGQGKPLDYSNHNPFIDTTTHNLNKIMVNNGFMPDWIMLFKEIRTDICSAREKLAIIREQLGPPPYSELDDIRWDFHVENFQTAVDDINKKINKFNFIVPFMEKQMVLYDAKLNVKKVVNNHHSYLPRDEEGKTIPVSKLPQLPQKPSSDAVIPWSEVWSNIKDLFKNR